MKLTQRKATQHDVKAIVNLLLEDELGQNREQGGDKLDQRYLDAFALIDADPNQYLMVLEKEGEVVATCHLTMMPSLTFTGSTRMLIEAVRVSEKLRGQKIGEWMISQAIAYGKSRGTYLIQLTTNKKRPRAKTFYEGLGFEATHEGMKLYI
jgi:GNAT superfamily N-acetyltransferase